MEQRTYRRLTDGATSDFSVDPGAGWERYDGQAPPPAAPSNGLPLPAFPKTAAARFEYSLERIDSSFTVRGFERHLEELIGRYAAQGWRVAVSLSAGERTSHLLFERPLE
jgi:hypothetical protein